MTSRHIILLRSQKLTMGSSRLGKLPLPGAEVLLYFLKAQRVQRSFKYV